MKKIRLSKTDKAKWDEMVSIGVSLVTKHKWKSYTKHQRRFVRFVDMLLKKYGQTASLLATRADMMNRYSDKLPYLRKAYQLAETTRDHKEMVFTAHSLAEIYIFQRNLRNAAQWINKMKVNLGKYRDKFWQQECRELEEEMRTSF